MFSTTTNVNLTTKVYERPDQQFTYYQNYLRGGISICYLDDYLLYVLKIPQKYKENKSGWQEEIKRKLSEYQNNANKAESNNVTFILNVPIINLTEGDKEYIKKNLFLVDMNGIRYQAESVEFSPIGFIVRFPYKVKESDQYITLKAFDFIEVYEHTFTWHFVGEDPRESEMRFQ
jgi:hypothetical protein